MLDLDTFLTNLYVMADDFCKSQLTFNPQRGPQASLEPGEVITFRLVGQFWQFRSERDFYRFAERRLKSYFPRLPNRAQFNRLLRQHWQTIVSFWQDLVVQLRAQQVSVEVLDSVPVPVRNLKRRGWGWLAGPSQDRLEYSPGQVYWFSWFDRGQPLRDHHRFRL